MRAAVVVAAVDGVGAGVGALILGSNLWMAIMALTFVCAFVPLIGALFSGAVAVAVTLVTLGFWKAVIMLAVFVAVLQLEAHILQPLLLGRAVQIPPLVVLVGIAVGMTLSGVVGGIFAIPIVAFATGIIRGIRHQGEDLAELAPGSSGDDPPETGGPSRLADQESRGSGPPPILLPRPAVQALGDHLPGCQWHGRATNRRRDGSPIDRRRGRGRPAVTDGPIQP